MTPVLFTHQANADLAALAEYIAEDNPDRARLFITRVDRRCAQLGTFPYSGRLRLEFTVGRYAVRSITVQKRVLVFYRVAGNEVVEILRIVDGRRDFRTLFT